MYASSIGVLPKKRWNGINKSITRDHKIVLAKPYIGTQVLSLPGDKAILEQRLLENGFSINDMVGIQLAKCFRGGTVAYDGREIVRSLIHCMPSLAVYIMDFVHFAEVCISPIARVFLQIEEEKYGLPARNAFSRWLMRHGCPQFTVADLDFCSPFTTNLANGVVRLFEAGLMADEGVLFINHLKGMERTHNLKAVGGLHGIRTRYHDVPSYYITALAEQGYDLVPYKLIDYRDSAVTMMQYLFTFKRQTPQLDQRHAVLRTIMGESLYAERTQEYVSEHYEKHLNYKAKKKHGDN